MLDVFMHKTGWFKNMLNKGQIIVGESVLVNSGSVELLVQ